jgi:SNF family Na+-dependent transporter
VTALLPYVIILIFLVRGVTLDGAWIGLEFFFIPKWEKLGEVKVNFNLFF